MGPIVVEGAVTLSLPSEAPFSGHAAIGTPPSESVKACGPFMYLHLKPDEAQMSSMRLLCLQMLAHAAAGICIVLQYNTYAALCLCVCGLTHHTLYTCSSLKSGKPICRASQYAYLYAKSSSCRFINLTLTRIHLCEYTSPWSHFLHNFIKQATIKISMIENGVHLKTYVYDKWHLTWFYW